MQVPRISRYLWVSYPTQAQGLGPFIAKLPLQKFVVKPSLIAGQILMTALLDYLAGVDDEYVIGILNRR